MISLLISILILAIIFGLIWWVVTLIPLPAPFAKVAQAAVALIFLIVLLSIAFGGVSMPLANLR